MKTLLEKRYGLKLANIPKPTRKTKYGGHEVGKKYFCSYWCKVYEVLRIIELPLGGWQVVCRWQDGSVNSHSTRLIPGKDFEVISEEKALSGL
jgi:hypothetical protein